MTALNKDNLFRPVPSRTETKADITNRVAREIIKAETDRRHAKTELLRAARLAQEAQNLETAAGSATKPRARKASQGR